MEYRNTTQFENDVKFLTVDQKTAIKEETFATEAKLIARVQQLKLTRDISDWKQAKSYTIVDKTKLKIFYKSDYSKYQDIDLNTQNIPEVWMQLIFALYEANAKYGISLDFSSNAKNYFKVKKRDTKEQISLCLGLPTTPKKYDVFTFQTDYDVVIDPQSIETKQDPSLGALQELIKKNTDSNLNKYATEFKNNADFGGGIPWGLSLALFLPMFHKFYTGEKESSQISGNAMKIEDGHENNWSVKQPNVTQIDTIYDDAKREIETALKQEKTYKLEDFEDIVRSLLDLYKEADRYTTKDPTNMKQTLKDIYSKLQTKHDNNPNVKNLDEIKYFTTAKDTLISKDTFDPEPNGSWGNYDKGRAKGFVVLMLHIIGQITKQSSSSNFVFLSKVATQLGNDINATGNFNESANVANFNLIITAFDDYFSVAANKLKELKDRYNNLLTEYNDTNTKMTTAYQRQYPLPKQNLDDAKALVDLLNEKNVLAQQSTVDAKLKQVEKDAATWTTTLAQLKSEQDRINKAGADLSDAQNEWNKLVEEFKTETGLDYTEPNPSWPDINNMIKASNPTDFTTQASLFDTSVKSIRTLEIKKLRDKIDADKTAKDALPKIHTPNFGSNIVTIAKKSELKARVNKETDPAFAPAKENVDVISGDPILLEGLLHALWGKENNNKQAVTAGLFRAFL